MVPGRFGGPVVFVRKGSVEAGGRDAAGRERPTITLRGTRARRFAVSGASEVADRERKFARLNRKVSLDHAARPAKILPHRFLHNNAESATDAPMVSALSAWYPNWSLSRSLFGLTGLDGPLEITRITQKKTHAVQRPAT